jgi:hypothetical protein
MRENPKSEIRNPKDLAPPLREEFGSMRRFGFWFRISDFELRIFPSHEP